MGNGPMPRNIAKPYCGMEKRKRKLIIVARKSSLHKSPHGGIKRRLLCP
jgi:hypothetical protein